MAFNTFDGGVVVDAASNRAVPNQIARVYDDETGGRVQTYIDGEPRRIASGAHGLIPQFQTEDSTRRVRIEVGPVRLRQWSQEMIAAAAAAGDDISSALEQVEVARSEAAAIVPRMEQIEVMAGLAPGEVTDAQTANLITQPLTATRDALNAASVQAVSPRVGATRVDVVNSAATLDSVGIQAVINASPAGAEFYFSTEGGQTITLGNAPLAPSGRGQKFVHDRAVTLRQPNLYKPVYDVLDRDDVTIHDLTAVGPDARPASGSAFRDSSTANYQAAVWSNSNRTRITGKTRTTNFKIGVNLSAWDTATQADKTYAHRDNYIEDLEAIGSDFGVLYYGQDGLTIDNVSTSGHIDSSNGLDPNHCFYGSGDPTIRSRNVHIQHGYCKGLAFGQAFQAKYTDGFSFDTLLADECSGLLNLIDVHDIQFGQMMLRSTIKQVGTPLPLLTTFAVTPARGQLGSIFINDTADSAAGTQIISAAFDNATVSEITTISNRIAEGTDVLLAGDGLSVGVLKTKAAGVASRSLRLGKPTAQAVGVSIGRHETVNASRVVTFTADSAGTSYRYTPSGHRGGTYTGTGIIGEAGATYTVEGDPAAPLPITVKTANYTMTAADRVVITNGSTLVYLPAVSTITAGKEYTVKNTAATALTVATPDVALIDGADADTLAQNAAGRYVYTGTNWAKV